MRSLVAKIRKWLGLEKNRQTLLSTVRARRKALIQLDRQLVACGLTPRVVVPVLGES